MFGAWTNRSRAIDLQSMCLPSVQLLGIPLSGYCPVPGSNYKMLILDPCCWMRKIYKYVNLRPHDRGTVGRRIHIYLLGNGRD